MVKWYLVPYAFVVFVLGNLYRFTMQALWNIVFNIKAYAVMVFSKKDPTWDFIAEAMTSLLHEGSQSWTMLSRCMDKAVYSFEGFVTKAPKLFKVFTKWPTHTRTVRSFVHNDMRGNCQSMAHFAKRLLKKLSRRVPDLVLEYKIDIYVPLNPFKLARTHYIVSGYLRDKDMAVPFVISNNNAVKNLTPDECAKNLLSAKGVHQYVWLTRKPWKVVL